MDHCVRSEESMFSNVSIIWCNSEGVTLSKVQNCRDQTDVLGCHGSPLQLPAYPRPPATKDGIEVIRPVAVVWTITK